MQKYLKKLRSGVLSFALALLAFTTTHTALAQDKVFVDHAMGTIEVSAEPKRIIALDNGALDNVLALGLKPVGAAPIFLDKPFTGYLADQAAGVEKVGTINEPNLESIAALKPDLILGSKDLHEAIYDKLSQIAPTVYTETLADDWKGRLKIHAAAAGKSAEADELLATYEDRLAAFKAKGADKEVSVLRGRSNGVVIYLKNSWSGEMIEEAGLKRPATQQADEFSIKATEEQIADFDGDYIIWFSRDGENYLTTKVQSSRLWKTLKAVKEDQVHRLDAGTWLSGMGIQARTLMLKDLDKVFEQN